MRFPLFTLSIRRLMMSLLCLLSFSLYTQNEEVSTEAVDIKALEQAFLNAINEGDVESFRNFFDEDMRSRNSADKLNRSFSQLKLQLGPVQIFSLDEKIDNAYHYRSVHEKMITLKVVFELNTVGELSKMMINSNYSYADAPTLSRNNSELILPFHDEWYVFWGGKEVGDNYHNSTPNMLGAYDFWVMGENGKSHQEGASSNEDFYAFGRDIIAPVAGKVIYVADGVADNDWPAMNRNAGFGNLVLIETAQQEYLLFAHLQQHSIKVEAGQMVAQGELLGLCGNSGNSTEPHLHFQLQNIPDLVAATGAWIHFKKINLNGEVREDYLPRKGDKVSN